MFNRLRQTFPNLHVLAQVSFGAMLNTPWRGVRNGFDRKIADFVLMSRALEVLVVIELDDASHIGREETDAKRQKLLEDAGYRVLRFANVPDIEPLLWTVAEAVAPDPSTFVPQPVAA